MGPEVWCLGLNLRATFNQLFDLWQVIQIFYDSVFSFENDNNNIYFTEF